MRPTLLFALLISLLWTGISAAQTPPGQPSFYTTYTYTGYTVYDTASVGPPTQVSGVGGTLTLRPNGTYEKRMSIVASGKPYYFNQTGTYKLAGDSIRFAFTDLKGADVQRGTFRFEPATQRLSITIFGYPAGNRGVYDLVAAPPKPSVPAPRARPKAASRHR
ncbi:hypothetical protein [Hymenobacter convexus]|uniref:hypothetical protein n=1 Tax=Hymenobacter sp. CA1UV-4 TaxID=3063782 RepID=UPI0027136A1D|nr:hypothetical protein [Hymenobacter sp. CA1UV-4]MDO7852054.1 hypothetical protein [Hymenobacter sp. CA1UV-4]